MNRARTRGKSGTKAGQSYPGRSITDPIRRNLSAPPQLRAPNNTGLFARHPNGQRASWEVLLGALTLLRQVCSQPQQTWAFCARSPPSQAIAGQAPVADMAG